MFFLWSLPMILANSIVVMSSLFLGLDVQGINLLKDRYKQRNR